MAKNNRPLHPTNGASRARDSVTYRICCQGGEEKPWVVTRAKSDVGGEGCWDEFVADFDEEPAAEAFVRACLAELAEAATNKDGKR